MKPITLHVLACGALLAGGLVFAPVAQAQTTGATGTTSGPASPGYKAKPAGPSSTSTVQGNAQMPGGAAGKAGKPGSKAGPVPQNAPSIGASGSGSTTTKQ